MLPLLYNMHSGTWLVIVIPSIIALIFSVFVTIGIIADVSNRAKQLQLNHTQGSVAILTPSPSIRASPK
jgi:hypothetical protein